MQTKKIITWNTKYSVGIKIFDEQHKKLIDLLNCLFDSMLQGKSNNVLDKLFSELLAYTEYHFETEEKYFKKFNYDSIKHVAEHNELRKKVVELNTQSKEKELFISKKLLTFLNDWVVNHILVSDKKYTEFLNSNGLY